MITIKITELRPGMRIAAPVRSARGDVLFAAGETLTQKHLRALKAWGVPSVAVEGRGAETPETGREARAPIPKAKELSLEYRFRKTNLADPVIQELKRIVAELESEQGI